MNDLNYISRKGKWIDSVDDLNENFKRFETELVTMENDVQKCKGLFPSLAKLREMYPDPLEGSWAYVGAKLPAPIYVYFNSGGWTSTGKSGGGNLDPTDRFANSNLLNNVETLYTITTSWLQTSDGTNWSTVSSRKLKINSSATEYKINLTSLEFGEEGQLLKISTIDPYLYEFNKGSFVSMYIVSSDGISKNYTTGILSWTIDSTYFIRTISGIVQNRMPVAGDSIRVALSFKSAANNDVKVYSGYFKFSN